MKQIEERKYKEYYEKRFIREYAINFEEEVTAILKIKVEEGKFPSIDDRRDIIQTLFSSYIEQTGKVPKGNQVQRLANWMLVENLTDPRPDKVAIEPFPFMSKRQLRTRHFRERPSDSISKTRSHDDSEKPAKKRRTINLDDV